MPIYLRTRSNHAEFNAALQRLTPRFETLFQQLQALPLSNTFNNLVFIFADQAEDCYRCEQQDDELQLWLGVDFSFDFKMTLDDVLLGNLVRTLQKGIGRSTLPSSAQRLILPTIQNWYYPIEQD